MLLNCSISDEEGHCFDCNGAYGGNNLKLVRVCRNHVSANKVLVGNILQEISMKLSDFIFRVEGDVNYEEKRLKDVSNVDCPIANFCDSCVLM